MRMSNRCGVLQTNLCDTALELLAEVGESTQKPVYVLPDRCPPGRPGQRPVRVDGKSVSQSQRSV